MGHNPVAVYIGGAAAAVGAGVIVGLASAPAAAADDSGPGSTQRGDPDRSAQSASPAARGGHVGASRAAPSASAKSVKGSDAIDTPDAVGSNRVLRSLGPVSALPADDVAVQRNSAPTVQPLSPRQTAEPVVVPANPPASSSQAPLHAARQSPPADLPLPAAATLTVAPAAAGQSPGPIQPVRAMPARSARAENPHNFYLDPRGQRITVLKGLHFAIPGSLGLFIKQVYGTGTFTADSSYDLKDADQYDWNKFSGIAFTPLQPDKNSAMVGWRYNLNTREYEIAPFYNVNKERILPNEQTEVISVPADATFDYRVDYSGVTISYGDKTVFKPYPPGLSPNVWTSARVSGWFGGNEAAPRTLSYYLSFNWW